jgi:hypothetical protein
VIRSIERATPLRSKLVILVLLTAACAPPPRGYGTLLLSNPHFGPTHVEAVITGNADCGSRGPGYVSTFRFVLPNNATRIVDVPAGSEVCWRRDRSPDQPVAGEWSDWDRAFVAPGTTIDANL